MAGLLSLMLMSGTVYATDKTDADNVLATATSVDVSADAKGQLFVVSDKNDLVTGLNITTGGKTYKINQYTLDVDPAKDDKGEEVAGILRLSFHSLSLVKDENGNPKKDENGYWKYEYGDVAYVATPSYVTSNLNKKADYSLKKDTYTVGSDGKVNLTVYDRTNNETATETVTIDGIAVVYQDAKNTGKTTIEDNLVSTNSRQVWNEFTKADSKGTTSVALGKNTWVSMQDGNKAQGILFGNDTYTGGIAIGENVKSLNNSISVGINSYNGKIGNVDLANYDEVNALGVGSTSVGSNSYTSGSLSTNMGAYNIQTTDYLNGWSDTYTLFGKTFTINNGAYQNFGSTLVGTMNSIESYGTKEHYSGVANSIVGVANKTQNSNGSLIFGAGNEITNSIGNLTGSAYGDSVTDAADSFREMVKSSESGGAVLAIGGGNKADWVKHSQLMGVNNTVTGTEDQVSEYVFVDGYDNTVTNAKELTVIGSRDNISNIQSSIVLGNDVTMSGGENPEDWLLSVISLGNNNEVTASQSVALGDRTKVSVIGGVALGADSVADRAAGTFGEGYTKAYGNDKNDQGSTWVSNDGAVSIGGKVKTGEDTYVTVTRQITNLAAGSADTDAVNVAQLKAVHDALNAQDKGNVKYDTKKDENGKTVIDEDGNPVYNYNSVTMGGDTYNTENHTGGTSITNVAYASGKDGSEVVNVDYLNNAISNAKTEVTKNDQHLVANPDGSNYKVSDENKVTLKVQKSVDENGNKTYDDVVIEDVAKASDVGNVSKIASDIKNDSGNTTVVDAVNNLNNKVGDLNYYNDDGSQKYTGDIKNGDSTTKAIGKLSNKLSEVNETAGKHTTLTTKTGNLIVKTTQKEGEALNYDVSLSDKLDLTKDGSVNIGDTVINNGGIKVGDTTSITNNAVTVGDSSLTTNTLKVGGNTYITNEGINANGQKVTNVAAGTEDTDAVNYGQLKETNQQVINNSQNISNLYGSVDKLGNRINRVGAGAAALAALHPLDFDPDDKWDFAVGYGNYRGANAAAVGAYYRPNEDTMFSVGGSMGGGENMVNVGFSVKLGRGTNNVTTSKVAMAKEIKDLRATVEELTALVNQLVAENAQIKTEIAQTAPERFEIVNIERDEEVEGLLPIERVRAIETDEAQAAGPYDVAE